MWYSFIDQWNLNHVLFCLSDSLFYCDLDIFPFVDAVSNTSFAVANQNTDTKVHLFTTFGNTGDTRKINNLHKDLPLLYQAKCQPQPNPFFWLPLKKSIDFQSYGGPLS